VQTQGSLHASQAQPEFITKDGASDHGEKPGGEHPSASLNLLRRRDEFADEHAYKEYRSKRRLAKKRIAATKTENRRKARMADNSKRSLTGEVIIGTFILHCD
jgi:hypothetical protein